MRANVYLSNTGIIVECVVLRRVDAEDHFSHFAPAAVGASSKDDSLHASWVAAAGKLHQRSDDDDPQGRSLSTRATLPPVTIVSEEASLLMTNGPPGASGSVLSSPIFTPRSGATATPRSAISLPSSQGFNPRRKTAVDAAPARYMIRTALHPHRDMVVDYRDLIPFGYLSPSEVFGVRGRHLNHGMSLMVLDDGNVILERYPRRSVHSAILEQDASSPLQRLIPDPAPHLLSKLGEQQEAIRKAKAESEGGALAAMVSAIQAAKRSHNVRTCTMPEIQLLPMLSHEQPTPPLHVGTHVKARRRGHCGRLFHGVVLRATYDCTYTIQFESDKQIEAGVLHNDVLVYNESEADDVGVRDVVQFTIKRREEETLFGHGTVVAAVGHQRYHVHGRIVRHRGEEPRAARRTESDDQHVARSSSSSGSEDDDDDRKPRSQVEEREGCFAIHRSCITHIAPRFSDAAQCQFSDVLLPVFRALGAEEAGTVPWAAVVKYFSEPDYGDQPMRQDEWGTIHREIFGSRMSGAVGETPVEMAVTYPEFEYIAMRIVKLKW